MRYDLYYDPASILNTPDNSDLGDGGIEAVISTLKSLPGEYTVHNVAELSPSQLEDLYVSLAVPPSVRKRYRIRSVFGTNKYPGCFFGKGVPALVLMDNGRPLDVFPHEQDGRIVTIKEYLDRARAPLDGRELAERMDALRRKIGPIGVRTSELIDDGRRR